MNHKQFLVKSGSAKISAMAFITSAREFLCTGELSQLTQPILSKVDSREVMPTPALDELRKIVYNHMLLQAQVKVNSPKSQVHSSKNYLASVYDNAGELLESKVFASSVSAESWIDNQIVESIDDYGVITCSHTSVEIRVNRIDSIRRKWCDKGSPIMSKKGTSHSWKNMKVCNTKVHFSHG